VVLGLSARYVWDAAGILVLCAGLAFMPLADGPSRWQTPRRLSRPEFAAATTLVAAIVVGSLWSFYDYPTDPAAAEAASYIATARVALADAPSGAVIVDDPTPVGVTGGFFGPVTNAAAVLSPLPFGSPGSPGSPGSRPVFITQPDGTYDHLLEFDGFGRLVPAGIYGASSPPVPAGGACWADTFGDVAVPLTAVAANASTLRIGYLAGSPAQVLITFGTRSALYSVERGLHAVYFPISGDNVGTVVIQQVSGLVPCIGNVQAGVLLPSEAGPAIPPFALAG
jgi:hypothetical protein